MKTAKNIQPIAYVHLEITGKCNFSCKYCYNDKYRLIQNELSLIEIKKIIDQLVASGGNFFVISGGEPFMRQDIFEILQYLKEKKLPVRILTNGSLITEEKLQLIKTDKLVGEFRISLDSISQADLNRGDNIPKIINTLHLINEAKIPLVINTVLTENTYPDLMRLYEFIKKLKISAWRIDLPFYYGKYTENLDNLEIKNKERLFLIFSELIEIYLKEKPLFAMDIVYVFRTKIIENGILEHGLNTHPCDYMKDSITIRPNGDISFCPTLPITFGNIRKSTLQKVLANKKRTEFMKITLKDLAKCPECKYLRLCGGGCRADAYFETRDLKREDKKFCQYMPLFEKYILPVYPEEQRNALKKMIGN